MTYIPIPKYVGKIETLKIEGFPGLCYKSKFDVNQFNDKDERYLSPELVQYISGAVAKRKAEFIVGRCLAKKALYDLGASDLLVTVGENRSPSWPEGYTGSITHTSNYAICAVIKDQLNNFVGIDAEQIIDPRTAEEIMNVVVSDSELKLLSDFKGGKLEALTLIFSAKESLFKALYKFVNRYFDFKVARIVKIDFSSMVFTLQLKEDLSTVVRKGQCFSGRFQVFDHFVFTSITGTFQTKNV